MRAASFSLPLRERVGVREAAQSGPAALRHHTGLQWPAAALVASLTPTLSRREREKEAVWI